MFELKAIVKHKCKCQKFYLSADNLLKHGHVLTSECRTKAQYKEW